jgi:hypothetical protein
MAAMERNVLMCLFVVVFLRAVVRNSLSLVVVSHPRIAPRKAGKTK